MTVDAVGLETPRKQIFETPIGLAKTTDFVKIERMAFITQADYRNTVIFPEKIDGQYACYHRPMSGFFRQADIWYATSPARSQ